LHARAAQADAGAHRIDLLVVAPDGNLGAVAGLAGDAPDLDRAVGDFGDLRLKATADEIRMGAGKDDFQAATLVLDGEDVGADAVADVVLLRLHAFAGRHHALELAEVDQHVAAVEAADGAGNDVAGAVLELLVDHLLLRLAQTLHHRLFRGLHGDAAEILRRHVELELVAGLGAWGLLPRHR